MQPDMRLEQALKEEAARQGFILAGITSPEPPAHIAVFESWLGAGLHGEMVYLANESSRLRRADPRQILPECQSILALGVPYLPAEQGIGIRGKGGAGDSPP
jgi:epoxyqueuosine reductase